MKYPTKPNRKNQKKSLGRQLAFPVAVIIVVAIILVLQNPFTSSSSTSTTNGANTGVGTRIGQTAPGFTLRTIDGKSVSLSDFRGKPVVVNFWATWCPFCVQELPDFETVGREFGDAAVIFSINRGEPLNRQLQGLQEYQASARITFTKIVFLDDPNDEVANLYGVPVMPTTYFLDQNGLVIARKFGQVFPDEIREKIRLVAGHQQVILDRERYTSVLSSVYDGPNLPQNRHFRDYCGSDSIAFNRDFCFSRIPKPLQPQLIHW